MIFLERRGLSDRLLEDFKGLSDEKVEKIIRRVSRSSRLKALKILCGIMEGRYNSVKKLRPGNAERLLKAVIKRALNLNDIELTSYSLDPPKISLSIENRKYLMNIYEYEGSPFEDKPKTGIIFEISPSNKVFTDSRLEIVLSDKLLSSKKCARKLDLYLLKILKHFEDIESVCKEVVIRVPTILLKLKILSGGGGELKAGIDGVFFLEMEHSSKELDEILRWRLKRIKSKMESQLSEFLGVKREEITF